MSIADRGFDVRRSWEYENGFWLTSQQDRLGKALAHYELYKRVGGLPGAIVECGVYKGVSLLRFATIRNLLEAQSSRKVIGFDAFGKFPDTARDDDKAFVARFAAEGGDGLSEDDINEALRIKGLGNVELVSGDIRKTLPVYLARHPELRIALLHIDVDVEDATAAALSALWPRVVAGGIVALDDYGCVGGATDAIDAFAEDRGLVVRKLGLSKAPSFIVKE